jgi:hypothetical protein
VTRLIKFTTFRFMTPRSLLIIWKDLAPASRAQRTPGERGWTGAKADCTVSALDAALEHPRRRLAPVPDDVAAFVESVSGA